VALGGEIVNLVRLHELHDADEVRGVREVPVVQADAQILLVRVLVQMVYTVRVEERRAALDSVHLVSLLEEEFGEVGTILPGDAGNQSFLRQIIDLHLGHGAHVLSGACRNRTH
jgi:hypothetical protein